MDNPRQGQQRELLRQLEEAVEEAANETAHGSLFDDRERAAAFTRVAQDWLGLSDDEEAFGSDGAGDRGIDYYRVNYRVNYRVDDGFSQIYQFKATGKSITESSQLMVDANKFLPDVSRIIDYVGDIEEPKIKQNKSINNFQRKLQNKIRSYYDNSEEHDKVDANYTIEINVILGAKGLTPQCEEQFDSLRRRNEYIGWRNKKIHLKYNLIFIDDLLQKQWALNNAQWKKIDGEKYEKIKLRTMPSDIKKNLDNDIIKNRDFTIALVRAIDLVTAYEKLGYQMFEQNVRCKIKKSKVNDKIQKQIGTTEKGIKEFHTLNNGVTILAQNVQIKNSNEKNGNRSIVLLKPGVINGLQTITSLAEAYPKIPASLKPIFDEECYILARIFEEKKINNVNNLILATNTQNTMDERNLRSNDQIQIDLEQSFAKEKPRWFYQRKQFAWEAFKGSDRWSTLPKVKKGDFICTVNNKKRERLADNANIARAWLSFIGYASDAMHDRKQIFISDKYYENIFKKFPNKHGATLSFKSFVDSIGQENFSDNEPSHHALLFSFLVGELSRSIPPSNHALRKTVENKESSKIKKLSAEGKSFNPFSNEEYLIGYLKNRGRFLFVEFVGYAIFKRYGNNTHKAFCKILTESDMKDMYCYYDDTNIKKSIENKKFIESDSIALCWHIFDYLITDLVRKKDWRKDYELAEPKGRFLYSKETRKLLIDRLKEFEDIVNQQKRPLDKTWSQFIDEKKDFWRGIFPFDV